MIHKQDGVPQVDIIILSWNRVEDTLAAIGSALEQRGIEQRVLVVDQGSEAANLSKLEDFVAGEQRVRLQKLPQNVGVAEGRNLAAALGSAPYIVALDSDAVFAAPGMIARAVRHLEAHRDLCALGFRITNYFTRQNDLTSWDYPSEHAPDQQFYSTRFIGAGHALRRSVFETAGGYDGRLFFCGEELDLCYRMLNLGYRIEYLPQVEILHKVSPEHRVHWERGRFFFTVRNALYSMYKFGVPPRRRLLSAGAFLVKGARNGVLGQAARGILASRKLCREFKNATRDTGLHSLSAATWEYIRKCEPQRHATVAAKIRKQFAMLPHRGRA